MLRAFALHKADIGYCQSLNFLAAFMLLLMTEEGVCSSYLTLLFASFIHAYVRTSRLVLAAGDSGRHDPAAGLLHQLHDRLQRGPLRLVRAHQDQSAAHAQVSSTQRVSDYRYQCLIVCMCICFRFLTENSLEFPLITLQWFMCLFINTFRPEVTLRIWDILVGYSHYTCSLWW